MDTVSSVEGKLSAGKTPYDLTCRDGREHGGCAQRFRPVLRSSLLRRVDGRGERRWIRAMQIIADLEGTTRGPYGGCVGYFSFNGNLDICITISTALLKDGKAYAQAGGGWVNDSEPESGISGNGEQEQSDAQRRGAGGIILQPLIRAGHRANFRRA